VSTVHGEPSAARRLLAQSVMASTYQLVRGLRDQRTAAAIRRLMRERQRLLAELARDVDVPGGVGSLAALKAVVAESDRTLEQLIG
jgi:hypothetical protein